jgi:hypothetical protein
MLITIIIAIIGGIGWLAAILAKSNKVPDSIKKYLALITEERVVQAIELVKRAANYSTMTDNEKRALAKSLLLDMLKAAHITAPPDFLLNLIIEYVYSKIKTRT